MFRSANHGNLVAMKGRDPRVDSLLQRHEELEEDLESEISRPAVDWDEVRLIKLEKLRVLENLQERVRQL